MTHESVSEPSAASSKVLASSSHVLRISRDGGGKNQQNADYVSPSTRNNPSLLNV